MKISLLFAALFALLPVSDSNNIEFSPRPLFKEIKRISGCNQPVSKQIKAQCLSGFDSTQGIFRRYSNTKPIEFAYIGRVNTCRAEGCTVNIDQNKIGRSEFFDYFILFDSTASILSVRIYNYEATHGQEITVKTWLKQFVGYNSDRELIIGKDIDAISGATISVNNISFDIQEKTGLLKKYLNALSNSDLE